MNDSPEAPRFARSGVTDPAGKCDAVVEFKLPAEMRDELDAFCVVMRVPRSEYIRRLIARDLYGSLGLMKDSVRDEPR
jgi:hypothetical protein